MDYPGSDYVSAAVEKAKDLYDSDTVEDAFEALYEDIDDNGDQYLLGDAPSGDDLTMMMAEYMDEQRSGSFKAYQTMAKIFDDGLDDLSDEYDLG